MSKRIYIADDEKNIRLLIQTFLSKEGYETTCFADGTSLFSAFTENPPDLIILDIMMPGIDGLSLCAMIRQKSDIPLMIVSAKDSELDRITGINLGSDDYLVKPFSPLELVARVKALFRRMEMSKTSAANPEILHYGDLELSLQKRIARRGNDLFLATPTEFDFLTYLIKNRERAVSKSELLKVLWQFDFDADTRVADDLVKRLRRKLKEQDSSVQIETVWGFGFRLSGGEDR